MQTEVNIKIVPLREQEKYSIGLNNNGGTKMLYKMFYKMANN